MRVNKTQVVTVYLSKLQIEAMDEFIDNSYFVSSTELIREAVRIHLVNVLEKKDGFAVLPWDPIKHRSHKDKLKNVAFAVPEIYISAMDKMIKLNRIKTRSDFIRDAIDELTKAMLKLNSDLTKFTKREKAPKPANQITFNDGSELQIQSISEYMKLRRESALLQRNA